VLPTEQVRARDRFHALLDRSRARHQRDHARSLAISPFFDALFWLVGRMMLLVPIILVWAGVFVVTEIVRPALPEYDTLLGVAPLAMAIPFGLLLFGAALGIERFFRRRASRFAAMQRLARHFHGQASDRGTRALFDWLDAHWAGPAPDGSMVFHNSPEKPVQRLAWFWFGGHAVVVVLAESPLVRRFDLFL
jgi:hypothetical protein